MTQKTASITRAPCIKISEKIYQDELHKLVINAAKKDDRDVKIIYGKFEFDTPDLSSRFMDDLKVLLPVFTGATIGEDCHVAEVDDSVFVMAVGEDPEGFEKLVKSFTSPPS
jgi:hypothetical protein